MFILSQERRAGKTFQQRASTLQGF
jgi:hypothetical protein